MHPLSTYHHTPIPLTVDQSVLHTLNIIHFRKPSEVHSALTFPAAISPPATLCMKRGNAYSLFVNGLSIKLVYIITFTFCQGVSQKDTSPLTQRQLYTRSRNSCLYSSLSLMLSRRSITLSMSALPLWAELEAISPNSATALWKMKSSEGE